MMVTMTDLTRLLESVEGDGVHWTLEACSDLNGRTRSDLTALGGSHEEGGDPACWAHLFESDSPDTPS